MGLLPLKAMPFPSPMTVLWVCKWPNSGRWAWGEVGWKLLWGFLTVREESDRKRGSLFPPKSHSGLLLWYLELLQLSCYFPEEKASTEYSREKKWKKLGSLLCWATNQPSIAGCLPQHSNLLLTLVWVCASVVEAKASSLMLRKCQFMMMLTMMWKIKTVGLLYSKMVPPAVIRFIYE